MRVCEEQGRETGVSDSAKGTDVSEGEGEGTTKTHLAQLLGLDDLLRVVLDLDVVARHRLLHLVDLDLAVLDVGDLLVERFLQAATTSVEDESASASRSQGAEREGGRERTAVCEMRFSFFLILASSLTLASTAADASESTPSRSFASADRARELVLGLLRAMTRYERGGEGEKRGLAAREKGTHALVLLQGGDVVGLLLLELGRAVADGTVELVRAPLRALEVVLRARRSERRQRAGLGRRVGERARATDLGLLLARLQSVTLVALGRLLLLVMVRLGLSSGELLVEGPAHDRQLHARAARSARAGSTHLRTLVTSCCSLGAPRQRGIVLVADRPWLRATCSRRQ